MTPMLFVTGMLRCGTTLLEKLLAGHPEIALLSQPFPFLFFDAKRAFLQTLGREDPYPLGDLFLERDYRPADFARYLQQFRISSDQLRAIFAAMASYSGQCTRFTDAQVESAIAAIEPGDFAGTLAQLYRVLAPRASARWHGGKETICEEFVPYLLAGGAVCAIIVRDPRDMLASMNHGRGQDFAGAPRPTLFNLRQWRKSVAFALHLQPQPRFVWLRYEDLVADPYPRLNAIAGILEVSPFIPEMFADGIRDQAGGAWRGNSSHASRDGIDAAAVGTYARTLPPEVIRFAEAVCYPELAALGYPVSIERGDVPAIIAEYRDPYPGVREHLRDTFADPERAVEELARLDALEQPGSPHYVFDDVREILRSAAAR